MLDHETARTRVLEAAEELFYGRGVQAVGMDAVRHASGVSLKRLYQLFPSKEELVLEFLRQRDARWQRALADHVDARPTPEERITAVFDWLHTWFSDPGYRGCAFINSFGELGAVSPEVAEEARHHKKTFHDYLAGLVAAAGRPAGLAGQLALLAEGAITTAAIFGTPEPAHQARDAALLLLRTPASTRNATPSSA
ncbi:TetR/AcrR family transcriptional regulator [Streptantibioticus cattleyicolor]|uniref:Transcriptional regulator, TetR family n=1 Tax=Streptantibioticus cattleyicolor (strain ATCC 35852 / DSM 46488 / JCM 4925 / NBRC 14057 / NRRL 8057) TaxID=1003195 RepID=F8JN56_STREN|nr:TetR/AcrR family transcriptional regulator [Streptantibioticus cattleyicolor]AEW99193.1 transcriptional regulator, TetR family [Streptantibioticus cattleyicolor NRRL 8057 = DSM 46488]CCB71764.1 TetR-family protein transcriptional regulator [Streptantibioticus cattleyicolor NRRL 8057 = DSM 46488]